MSDENSRSTDELELENRLKKLVPAGHHLRRDTLMFRAGQRAGRRQSRPWQAVALGSLLGLVLVGWDGLRTVPGTEPIALTQVEKAAQPDVTQPTAPAARPSLAWLPLPVPTIEYLRLRDEVIKEGADALPVPPAYAFVPETMEPMATRQRENAPGSGWPVRLPHVHLPMNGDPS
jgi:hypothetical protein